MRNGVNLTTAGVEETDVKRPLRVAVVDDNADIRLLIALHLTLDERFELAGEARNGHEALALLERSDIDAMVLDMHMPGLPGSHVLRAVLESAPGVRVVAFSADTQTLVQAARDGAAATVPKGANLDGLLAALLREPAVA
jgi:DNA-binding NarL/FixJ family response regulator